jgi:hypothetical protein
MRCAREQCTVGKAVDDTPRGYPLSGFIARSSKRKCCIAMVVRLTRDPPPWVAVGDGGLTASTPRAVSGRVGWSSLEFLFPPVVLAVVMWEVLAAVPTSGGILRVFRCELQCVVGSIGHTVACRNYTRLACYAWREAYRMSSWALERRRRQVSDHVAEEYPSLAMSGATALRTTRNPSEEKSLVDTAFALLLNGRLGR